MRFSLLAMIGAALGAPTVMSRQGDIDYGFWDATYRTEGFAVGFRVELVAVYSNPGNASTITTTCTETTIYDSTTRNCPSYFSWSIGAPYGEGRQETLNISQIVDLNGEQITLYGSSLVELRSGPAPKGSSAYGRITAGPVPL